MSNTWVKVNYNNNYIYFSFSFNNHEQFLLKYLYSYFPDIIIIFDNIENYISNLCSDIFKALDFLFQYSGFIFSKH
jgi:hypothetical protein